MDAEGKCAREEARKVLLLVGGRVSVHVCNVQKLAIRRDVEKVVDNAFHGFEVCQVDVRDRSELYREFIHCSLA